MATPVAQPCSFRRKQQRGSETVSVSASASVPSASSTFVSSVEEEVADRDYLAKLNASVREMDPSPKLSDVEDDDLLVKELNSLSIDERQRAYEDIHGVSEVPKETPEMVAQELASMEKAIQKIKTRTAYEKARFLSPRYVNDRDFRLMFLRSASFDAQQAAERFVLYFTSKLSLFGLDRLVREITQADMSDCERAMLGSNFFQILPQKDSRGRLVMISFDRRELYERWRESSRVGFYMYRKMFQDKAMTTNGCVFVSFDCDPSIYDLHMDEDMLEMTMQYCAALPLKIQAYHFCYSNPKAARLMALTKIGLGKHGRVRLRAHYGDFEECVARLKTFGIPAHLISMCNASLSNLEYIEALRIDEERNADKIDRSHPTTNDIVMGRGRPYQEHPGNQRLLQIVEDNYDAYNNSFRTDKVLMFERIHRQLRSEGVRFLRKRVDAGYGESEWEEVSDKVAREKVSYSFRNKRYIEQSSRPRDEWDV